MNWIKKIWRKVFPDKPLLVALVDISGSIPQAGFSMVQAKLDQLSKNFRVYVLEFDIEVVNSYPYQGKLLLMDGAGGTSIRAAMNVARTMKPAMIMCFTDGYFVSSDLGTRRPECQVLWMMFFPHETVGLPNFGMILDYDGWSRGL